MSLTDEKSAGPAGRVDRWSVCRATTGIGTPKVVGDIRVAPETRPGVVIRSHAGGLGTSVEPESGNQHQGLLVRRHAVITLFTATHRERGGWQRTDPG
jgi:hypothetical protein